MRVRLRYCLTIIAAPALWVTALNVENLAIENGWDRILIGVSSTSMLSDWGQALTSPVAFALASFFTGCAAGAWAHWAATKFDRRDSKNTLLAQSVPASDKLPASQAGSEAADHWRAEIGGDVAYLDGVAITANAGNLYVASTDKREGQSASDGVRVDCFDLSGQADQVFGRASGYSTFRLNGSRSVVNRMSLLPDGDGLIVGTAFDDPNSQSSAFMATVAADGSLGSVFAGGIFSIGLGRDKLTYGWDALRIGGDFYLVASVFGDPLLHVIKVPAARPDESKVFGLRIGTESTVWPSVVRQAFPEDAVFVAGRMTDPGGVISDGFIAKVRPDGELDQSFAKTGWVSLQATFGLNLVHGVVGMEVLADGTVIVAGTGNDGFVVALDAQGSAMRRFGTNGLVIPRGLYGTEPASLAVSQSQQIIALGGTESDGNSIARPFVLVMDMDGHPTEAARGGLVYVETDAKAQMRDHTILSGGKIVSLIHEGDFLRQSARVALVGQKLP